MRFNKGLTGLVLGSSLLALGGCEKYKQYHFSGTIDGEQIEADEVSEADYFRLKVTRPDGIEIIFEDDIKYDLKIDHLTIRNGKNKTFYSRSQDKDPRVKEVLDAGQEQFNVYLAKIHAINSAPILGSNPNSKLPVEKQN